MGAILLRIAPIHLRQPKSPHVPGYGYYAWRWLSSQITSALYLWLSFLRLKLSGSPFCIPVCFPGQSVFSVYLASSFRILLFQQHSWVSPFMLCSIAFKSRNFFASCLTTQSWKNFWIFFQLIAWTLIFQFISFKLRFFQCTTPKDEMKRFRVQLRNFLVSTLLNSILWLTWWIKPTLFILIREGFCNCLYPRIINGCY